MLVLTTLYSREDAESYLTEQEFVRVPRTTGKFTRSDGATAQIRKRSNTDDSYAIEVRKPGRVDFSSFGL
jgi:hypothetical protein